MGVPLIPFIAVVVPLIVLGMWGLMFAPIVGFGLMFFILPIYFWMRIITKTDDQRLLQLILRAKLSVRQKNRQFWGGAISYSPYTIKR